MKWVRWNSDEPSQVTLMICRAFGLVFLARLVGTVKCISCGVVVVQVQVLVLMESNDPGNASFHSAEIRLIHT